MLIQYSVENYKSIKNEIVINFRADPKYRNSSWVCHERTGASGIYKCVGFVGPNASGKTNIIESLFFAIKFIQRTIYRKESEKINVQNFMMDTKWSQRPSCFEFIFIHNKTKYVYGFSVTQNEIIEEYLIEYCLENQKVIFDRTSGQQYNFNGNDEKTQSELAARTNKNRLYLPVAAEWGYEPVKKAYDWFNFISRQYTDFNINSMIKSIISDRERKKLFIEELQKADFNIENIYIKKRKINQKAIDSIDSLLNGLLGDKADMLLSEINYEIQDIRVIHKSRFGESMDIALDSDSSGTSDIVQYIAELLYLGKDGGLMIEDELGKSFHTRLTQHFLNIIKNSSVNTGNTQLIFSSHDTKVLNILNPDQIYLVDKNNEGATCIKLLDDYKLDENDDIELGYLDGRFGRIPYMKG